VSNPTDRWYCRKCEDLTPHLHLHDTAHGIEMAHMVGTERYVCRVCELVTFSRDEGWNHFDWWLDKRTSDIDADIDADANPKGRVIDD
jgi:rubredoxin